MTNDENRTNTGWMSDDELDGLITASLERQELLEDVNREVMKEVRRSSRHETLRRWMRAIAFAFGLPALLLFYGIGIHYVCTHVEMNVFIWIALAVSTTAMLCILGKVVKNFSISKV